MNWGIDHIFFATPHADNVERAVAEVGLVFGPRRIHSGQGTANACAVFENEFFEILRGWGGSLKEGFSPSSTGRTP